MPPKGIINISSSTGFIQLYDFDDIKKRDKFVSVFDPKGKELVKVIGNYEFDEEIHCGLKDCNQPHKKGFIVLTSTQEETNIGNNCGERIFGYIQFSTLRKNYRTDYEIENNRKIISESIIHLDKWNKKLDSLYQHPKGATWALRMLTNVLRPSVTGTFVCSELNKMKKNLNGSVIIERKATDDEIEILKAQQKKPPYIVELSLGEIKYISVLSQATILKSLVVNEIKDTLQLLGTFDPSKCKDNRLLQTTARKINSMENNFKQIESIIETSIKFFDKKNFSPLYRKLTEYYFSRDKEDNIKLFLAFLNAL